MRQLFDSALEIEPEARAAYLERVCADDRELRREVLSLLKRESISRDDVGEVVADVALSAARAKGAQLKSGDRVGQYTILEVLGAGGMGQVYKAEDHELRRMVALKVFTGWSTPGSDHLRRFRREARVLASMNHSNIVTIYSVEQEGDLQFLTMELVQGKTLDRVIPLGGLRLERFFDLALPLVKAVAAAHELGVTHRDLKPANVMLSDSGEVKVLDFGLAKRSARETAGPLEGVTLQSAPVTGTGIVVGTVPYMSPEQVRGEAVNHRSDVFSLGAILYEMVTGSRPFKGESAADLISVILKEEPPPVSGLAHRLPPRLARIIERCLHKDPKRRYQDATSLARELAALKESVELHPKISSGLSRLWALAPRTRLSRLAVASAALVALSSIPLGLNWEALKQRLAQPPPAPKIASLAVLPLANLSGREDQEFLADGMTEILITELSKIRALKVISRTSVMRFKNARLPLPEIADELGVDAVVEGSVQRSGERVRVTAKLIHAPSEEHLWVESFERDLKDLLAVQGEVARAIVAQVEVTLTPEETARLSSGRSVDPRASEAYLRGRSYWNNFAFVEAVEAYEEAIALDPDFARAFAGLAEARQMQGVIGYPHLPRVSYPLAQAAANRALELDDALAEAHAAQGWIALHYEWDWEAAEREFRLAMDLNPNLTNGHKGLAYYLAAMGRFDEAVASAELARELDPLARLGTFVLSEILYYGRQYERASFELGEHWDEGFVPMHWIHSRLMEARGDPHAAAWAAFRNVQVGTKAQPLEETLEEMLRGNDLRGFWQRLIEFQTSAPREGIHAKNVAENYGRLGNLADAFEWLDRAYERRDPLFNLGVDPIWDPLRGDPRFNELLTRLKLPQAVLTRS